MILMTRLVAESTSAGLGPEWTALDPAERGRGASLVLIRTHPDDPLGRDDLGALAPSLGRAQRRLSRMWSLAQLAADATLVGSAIGLRVALVFEEGMWFGEVVVRNRARIRLTAGRRCPTAAIQDAHRVLANSLNVDSTGSAMGVSSALRLVAAGASPRD